MKYSMANADYVAARCGSGSKFFFEETKMLQLDQLNAMSETSRNVSRQLARPRSKARKE